MKSATANSKTRLEKREEATVVVVRRGGLVMHGRGDWWSFITYDGVGRVEWSAGAITRREWRCVVGNE